MPGKKILNVLMVSSESSEFVKVGGLADVVGALGENLSENGIHALIALPKFRNVSEKITEYKLKPIDSCRFSVFMEDHEETGTAEVYEWKGTQYLFIDKCEYYCRNGIYIDLETRQDFADNLRRFVFFNRGVLEAVKKLGFKPDIVHGHDWQSGLIPVYLKTVYHIDDFFSDTKVLFTAHNLAYQGLYPVEQFSLTGLDWRYFNINGLEYYGHLNLLKGGVVFADMVNTVSENYAKEVQTAEFGNGLEGVMRDKAYANSLVGIVNGVDYKVWDPAVDPYLKKKYKLNYSPSQLENKAKIKAKFMKEMELVAADEKAPLIGIVSPLLDQKGWDIIFEIIDAVLDLPINFVVLGTGKFEYENKLKKLARQYPGKMSVNIEFNVELSHYIEAASDIFLEPSRFEPCGLNQMYSLRYGTIPVVRNTGGLADTVRHEKNGFSFNNYDPEELLQTIRTTVEIFRNEPEKWKRIMLTAMKEDWSWEKSAKKYLAVYERLILK